MMEGIVRKLRFKGQERIAIINASDGHYNRLKSEIEDVKADRSIDPRFLYEFMVVFVSSCSEVKELAPAALHNLAADGVLWFVYPKKKSRDEKSDIDRDHGWEAIEDMGFRRVSQVAVDDVWSALRFRNTAFVKSAKKEAI